MRKSTGLVCFSLVFALILISLFPPVGATDQYRRSYINETNHESTGTTVWSSNFTRGTIGMNHTSVKHGTSSGNFTFKPGANQSTATTTPGATFSGFGWATNKSINGTIPAGSWSFQVVTTETTKSGTALIWVEVYKNCSGTTTELFHVQGSTNVFGATTSTVQNITSSQSSAFAVAGCFLITEFTLDVTVAGGTSTAYINFTTNATNTQMTYPTPTNKPPYHENVNGGTPSANTTTPKPGDSVNFTSFWYDDIGLDWYWLSWNTTGTFANTSITNFSAINSSWANVTVTVASSDEGKKIYGRTWANDSYVGNQNYTQFGTNTYVILTVQNVSPTVTSSAVNTTSTQTSTALCVNLTATDVGVGVSQSWIEITYPNGTVQNRTLADTGHVNCANVASDDKYGLAFDVGTTTGTLTVNRTWANDTLNNVGRQTPDPALNVTVTAASSVSFTLFILATSNTTSNATAPPGAPITPAINFTYAGSDGVDSNRAACNNEASQTCQTASNSIYRLFNTGTVSISWLMSLNVSTPTGISMFCDVDNNPAGAVTLTTSYQTISSSIAASGNVDVWCWANFSLAATGTTAVLNQHNATN